MILPWRRDHLSASAGLFSDNDRRFRISRGAGLSATLGKVGERLDDDVVGPYVDGRLCRSACRDFVDVVDPSTGARLMHIPAGAAEDVDCAVAAARRAFEDAEWSEAAPSDRKAALLRFAELIAADSAALDVLDAEEMGKPVSTPVANATAAASLMRFYGEAVDKVTGDVYSSDKQSLVVQRRVPRGVVAAVVPWNFPTYVAVLKIAPALAAGNCVVLKPSELSSRSAMRLAQLGLRAGIPPGVLNVVPGLGGTVGQALGRHMDVDMISFTGSTAVGKLMMQYAGQSNMKVVSTECGGKSPHIVFADGVDLDSAGDVIAQGILTNQGQLCSVGSRLLVQKGAEERLLERIGAWFTTVAIGNAVDPQTRFGPLASANQHMRVMQYIEGAEEEGAELVTGGRRALPQTGGYFVEPTLFRNVAPTSRIAREEIFGPVLCVTTFDDDAEAIRIANATNYGLAAYVWTAHLSTAMRVAKGVRSTVFVSAVPALGEGAGHAASSEPLRQSGIGTEGGLAGMETYLRRQLISFNHA